MHGLHAPFACLILAASSGPQLEPADPVGPDEVELAAEAVRVPFELARSRPVPVVEASLNGRGPFRFFLDTGASGCVLDTRLMSELGLASQGKTQVGDPSRNEPLEADVLRIEELALGGMRARGLPAVAFDRASLERGDGVRGVLGLSLFTRHLLTLDYGEGLVLVRAGALERDAPHVVPFELEGVPRVLIDVDGVLHDRQRLVLRHHAAAGLRGGAQVPRAAGGLRARPHGQQRVRGPRRPPGRRRLAGGSRLRGPLRADERALRSRQPGLRGPAALRPDDRPRSAPGVLRAAERRSPRRGASRSGRSGAGPGSASRQVIPGQDRATIRPSP
jgi:hypothetical protein